MGRFVTKLTRDFDNIWWLELSGESEPAHGRPISSGEAVVVLKILEQVRLRRLIIDVSNISMLDSQGLQFLALLYKHLARRNIQITLRRPSQALRQALHRMRYDQLFTLESDDGVGR